MVVASGFLINDMISVYFIRLSYVLSRAGVSTFSDRGPLKGNI